VNLWINAIAYQTTWLAAIGGAAAGWWWLGPLALLLFAAWQLPRSTQRRADLWLLACAALLGFAVDSLFAQTGLLSYASAVPWAHWAPAWIVALWASFALTLNHSLAWLKQHLQIAALLGALGAPLAYTAAARSGALAFPPSATATLLLLAATWAALAPALSVLATRLATPALSGVPR
jgi:hypothetical protein